MKKIKEIQIKELSEKELKSYNGGTLAFDIGWGIFWSIASGGGKNVNSIIEAGGVYGAHYAND